MNNPDQVMLGTLLQQMDLGEQRLSRLFALARLAKIDPQARAGKIAGLAKTPYAIVIESYDAMQIRNMDKSRANYGALIAGCLVIVEGKADRVTPLTAETLRVHAILKKTAMPDNWKKLSSQSLFHAAAALRTILPTQQYPANLKVFTHWTMIIADLIRRTVLDCAFDKNILKEIHAMREFVTNPPRRDIIDYSGLEILTGLKKMTISRPCLLSSILSKVGRQIA